MTRSAPSASGFWSTGVANVLSHAHNASVSWATRAAAAMSTTASSGFDGVYTQTSRVRGVIAREIAPATVMSMKLTSTPQGIMISRRRRAVP